MTSVELFRRLKEQVLVKSPVLKQILAQHGTEKIYDYTKRYLLTNDQALPPARKEEFLGLFHKQISRLLGEDVAKAATEHLRKNYFACTTEHHGPICNATHPTTLSILKDLQPGYPFIINLSTANVSLNNFDFPRGLVFTAKGKEETKVHRISFLPSNSHASTIFNFRAFTSEDIKKIKKILREKRRSFEISQKLFEQLQNLVDEIYGTPDVLACTTYSDQVTKTNFTLSQKMFPAASKVQQSGFIFLELESLVLDLIENFHLQQKTVVHEILFNPEYHQAILELFENIEGAFSTKDSIGSFLFWGVSPKDNSRVALWKDGTNLASSDKSLVIPLTPEGLQKAIKAKKILPGTLLIFIVIAFYYGLKCLGFFKQVNYLTEMKNAYLKLLEKFGQQTEAKIATATNTTDLNGDFALAFIADKEKNQTFLTSGIDVLLYAENTTPQELTNQSKNIGLEEALSPLMPRFYNVLYGATERDPQLASITPEEVSTNLGPDLHRDKKIHPCVSFPPEEPWIPAQN